MKKALYILLTICSVFLLVGCTSHNEREEVIDNMLGNYDGIEILTDTSENERSKAI